MCSIMAHYNKLPIPVLETKRLLLVPLEISDAPRIQSLIAHWNVLKYMASSLPWPYPDGGAEVFVRSILPKMRELTEYYWAITRKGYPDEGLIGVVGLTPDSEEDHRGFWLGEAYWGQGYMTETVAAVQDFAFGPLGMAEILLNNAEANVGSHRLKAKSGAEIVAVNEQDFIAGRLKSVRWRLTAENWAKHRDSFSAR